MKRKLSLAVALSGGSEMLILDEPSSGVDARSRRELWNILEKYRKSRTMLISTHYMDEAETLADQVCIIAKGRLKYFGSMALLKKTYGDGYHLELTLDSSSSLQTVREFIKNSIPSAIQDSGLY